MWIFSVLLIRDSTLRDLGQGTLESGMNIALRLLIFGIFSRGYGLITDLKDLNFTA